MKKQSLSLNRNAVTKSKQTDNCYTLETVWGGRVRVPKRPGIYQRRNTGSYYINTIERGTNVSLAQIEIRNRFDSKTQTVYVLFATGGSYRLPQTVARYFPASTWCYVETVFELPLNTPRRTA